MHGSFQRLGGPFKRIKDIDIEVDIDVYRYRYMAASISWGVLKEGVIGLLKRTFGNSHVEA